MFCIERFFPQWRNLSIHESSPLLGRGANRRLTKESPGTIVTRYYPGVAPLASRQCFGGTRKLLLTRRAELQAV